MSDTATIAFLEILIRVPAESLPQLRCVCKEWRRLIDHPDFLRLHVGRQLDEADRLLIYGSGKLNSLSLTSFTVKNFPALNTKVSSGNGDVMMPRLKMPFPSCHGLILLDMKLPWTVWNPCINEFLELPSFEHLTSGRVSYGGIGYDAIIGDYKVVRISVLCNDALETLIYTVKSDTWSKIEGYPDCIVIGMCEHGVFFNHALHWFAVLKLEGGRKMGCIIALDLGYEKYCQLPVPPHEYGLNDKHMDALGGYLFVSYIYNERFEIWMMNDQGGGDIWNKFVSLDRWHSLGIYMFNPRLISHSKSKREVVIMRNEDELFLFNVEKERGTIVSIGGICIGLSCQSFPLSLIRLNEIGDAYGTTASNGSLKRKRTSASDRFASKLKTHNFQIPYDAVDSLDLSDAKDSFDPPQAMVCFHPPVTDDCSGSFDSYDTKDWFN